MGSALHFILLFSAGLWALALSALSASRQFYVVKQKMNWADAQKHCREHYTDLATIENQEEMNALRDAVDKSTECFWIGLRQNNTIWERSQMRSWYWSDGAQYNYSNWNRDEPNSKDDDVCVEINSDYTWNDAKCCWNTPFICYKRRVPLAVINKAMTWREALRFCRQNHVDLVSVYSQEMQNWVEVVTKHASANMWLGLRHTCALGFWYWVRGDMICYQNWAPGYGTGVEDCGDVERTGAMLSGSKKWISLPQTHTLPFICITF